MGKLVQQPGNIDRSLNKQGIIDLATQNAQAITESGKYDLLKVYVELKRYETYLKALIEKLKQPALEQAAQEPQKSFEYHEARVNVATRTKWDFSVDTKWSELDQQIKQLVKEKKEREQYLKEHNDTDQEVNEETGELIEKIELPKEVQQGLIIRL